MKWKSPRSWFLVLSVFGLGTGLLWQIPTVAQVLNNPSGQALFAEQIRHPALNEFLFPNAFPPATNPDSQTLTIFVQDATRQTIGSYRGLFLYHWDWDTNVVCKEPTVFSVEGGLLYELPQNLTPQDRRIFVEAIGIQSTVQFVTAFAGFYSQLTGSPLPGLVRGQTIEDSVLKDMLSQLCPTTCPNMVIKDYALGTYEVSAREIAGVTRLLTNSLVTYFHTQGVCTNG